MIIITFPNGREYRIPIWLVIAIALALWILFLIVRGREAAADDDPLPFAILHWSLH